jgi:uncharacterized membrane protein YhaH (DUF805 family)
MQLVEAWKKVVLENYANFSGRARRSELWWYVLTNIIIFAVLNVLANITDLFSLVASLYWLAVLVPGIAVGVRRLHDIGKKGLWLLLAFIPIVGGLILIGRSKTAIRVRMSGACRRSIPTADYELLQ